MSDPSQRAVQRFFMAVGRAGSQWRDENTLPLFPLLLVMDAEMLEADAKYEGAKASLLKSNSEKP